MSHTVPGVIHGKTIELAADPGLADGQGVEITIRPSTPPDARTEAILKTAGSMAGDPEFDAVMGEIERRRRSARHRENSV